MAETITIAGKKLPKPLVFAGGAAVIGIVGYAYITKNSDGTEEDLTDTGILDTSGDERVPPTTLDTYDVKVDNRAGFKTDQEWHAAAEELLLNNYGVGSTSIAAKALDKYLRNLSMTNTEADMLHYVINTIGYPPSGQKSIRIDTSTPPTSSTTTRANTKPAGITGLVTAGNPQDISANWNRASGAVKYKVQFIQGESSVMREVTVTSPYARYGGGLKPKSTYRIKVWGISSTGVAGPSASKNAHTK